VNSFEVGLRRLVLGVTRLDARMSARWRISVIICLDMARQIGLGILVTSATSGSWQIQDAKQRFSEMIRAVVHDGPQIITRHGEEVAVVVDIAEYRRLTRPTVDLTGLLLGGPTLPSDAIEVLAEVEAERKADLGRPVDQEVGL
jgi:prevent-host-death family protein